MAGFQSECLPPRAASPTLLRVVVAAVVPPPGPASLSASLVGPEGPTFAAWRGLTTWLPRARTGLRASSPARPAGAFRFIARSKPAVFASLTPPPRARRSVVLRAMAEATPDTSFDSDGVEERETVRKGWWEKNETENMVTITSIQQFVDLLASAGDRLVIVEFFGTWCGACKGVYPKLCKILEEHPDVILAKVDFDSNKPIAKAMGVRVLPYFMFYRGADGRLDAFSASLVSAASRRPGTARQGSPRRMARQVGSPRAWASPLPRPARAVQGAQASGGHRGAHVPPMPAGRGQGRRGVCRLLQAPREAPGGPHGVPGRAARGRAPEQPGGGQGPRRPPDAGGQRRMSRRRRRPRRRAGCGPAFFELISVSFFHRGAPPELSLAR